MLQSPANILDALHQTIGQVFLLEIKQHFRNLIFPVLLSYFFVDTLVAKNGSLPVFHGYIYQGAVALSRLFHFQGQEKLFRAVQRIHVATARFNVHPYFTACALLGLLDGCNDALLFFGFEEFLFFLPGKQFHVSGL